ncbi:hypothetical protein VPH35_029227 [Triticum aestivum]|uniref:Uncharacterized protein n=1 Tax=Triticum turgidum subsp. durum TaxID=4567 RepID=A0A9R1PRA9_TRITD|nr:unnamed protein product [Triticum turgidum subsp. durum]
MCECFLQSDKEPITHGILGFSPYFSTSALRIKQVLSQQRLLPPGFFATYNPFSIRDCPIGSGQYNKRNVQESFMPTNNISGCSFLMTEIHTAIHRMNIVPKKYALLSNYMYIN